jgi:tetratricopeptide (TPR) repeat protein
MPNLVLFNTAKSFFLVGDYEEAIYRLKQLLNASQSSAAFNSGIAAAYDLLGQCYAATNNFHYAKQFYEKAYNENPEFSSAYHNHGLLIMQLAEQFNSHQTVETLNEALALLQKANELAPNIPMFLHSLASWHEQYINLLKLDSIFDANTVYEHFRSAIAYYDETLIIANALPNSLGQNQSAIAPSFIEIVKTNRVECLAQYGHFYYRHANYASAKACYEEVLTIESTHLIALNQLGMCFFKENFFSRARAIFEKILSITKDTQDMADAMLNIACAYRLENNYLKAEEELTQAESLAPEDPDIAEERTELNKAVELNKAFETHKCTLNNVLNQLNFFQRHTSLELELLPDDESDKGLGIKMDV